MIAITGLKKSFGDLVVLDGVDLEITTGQSVVVLGRSGGGKSVLLQHIIGLMRADAGKVEVDGVEVGALNYGDLAKLRQRFGMLFQMAALFDSMTVGENVGLALREHGNFKDSEVRGIVEQKLRLVRLPDIQDKRPSDLSGGMRKRVGLARAIAMEPDYVLYDEPTTGLDPVTAQQINVLIRDLQEQLNITSIVVTHDIASAEYVGDRMCLLFKGKIRFDGTPEAIRRSDDPVVRQFIRGEAQGPLTESVDPLEAPAPPPLGLS
jgi:phospholipid/cholesterol/gamma-HCH transport system ATP-binding protein